MVLGGRGPSFCAGADIGAMKACGERLVRGEPRRGRSGSGGDVRGARRLPEAGGRRASTAASTAAAWASAARATSRWRATTRSSGSPRCGSASCPALISPYVIRRLGDRARARADAHRRALRRRDRAARRARAPRGAGGRAGRQGGRARAASCSRAGRRRSGASRCCSSCWADTAWDEYRARAAAHARRGARRRRGAATGSRRSSRSASRSVDGAERDSGRRDVPRRS